MNAVLEIFPDVGIFPACDALGVSKASFYRATSPVKREARPEPANHPRSLSGEEKQVILETLNSPEFMDKAPIEIYAALLDRGVYLCSISTMYRILRENRQVKERRNQLRHPNYKKPELLATGSNQVWSWDITKLFGPVKWTYFHLYVIIDIYSRYVVGWMIAHRESSELAKRLIKETCQKQKIEEGQLTLHADRGSSMKSKPVALLMADLGVTKTHSRPYVSNDNPFSESQFKTLKYRPDFPARFGSIEDARLFCREFFDWYNWKHYHTGIGLLTPGSLHYGKAQSIKENRKQVLETAYLQHPQRFTRKAPVPPEIPDAVWINPPKVNTNNNEKQTDNNIQGGEEIMFLDR
jgi:putative transposase